MAQFIDKNKVRKEIALKKQVIKTLVVQGFPFLSIDTEDHGKIFDKVAEAAKYRGVSCSAVYRALIGEQRTAGGWQWRWRNPPDVEDDLTCEN